MQYSWLSKPLSFTSRWSTNQVLNLQVPNPKMQRANCIHHTALFYIGTWASVDFRVLRGPTTNTHRHKVNNSDLWVSSLWPVVITVPFSIQKSKETKIGTIRISQSYFSTLLWPGTVWAAQPSWTWGQSWVVFLKSSFASQGGEKSLEVVQGYRLVWLFVMVCPCGLEIPFLTCLKVGLVWVWEKCSEKSGSWAVCGRMHVVICSFIPLISSLFKMSQRWKRVFTDLEGIS